MGSRVSFLQTILLVGAVLLLAPGLHPQSDLGTDEVAQESLKFARIYGAVDENYMDPLDPDHTIFDGGIRGMLSILDPFCAFFDRNQFELLEQQTRGEALGFGSILYVRPGKILVLQTAEGSPSRRAGLGPGDEIVSVNGERLDRLDLRSLVELLQQSRSQRARLGVIRPGKVVAQDLELNPAQVALPTVDKAFVLAPGIGYLHLSRFEDKTTQEIVQTLTRLGGAHLKGLLLDLRDNHGGMLDAAQGVASLFLKPDLLLLTMRGRAVAEKSYRTFATPDPCDLPLIVLVNGNTVSAAEIIAAAFQEHDRALIVGEPTFGKGVVESLMPLSEKTGLALTTAQYFTPSGRSIQRPLPGTALAPFSGGLEAGQAPPAPRGAPAFHTDNGRPVSAGGGVAPDVAMPGRALDPWAAFLNQRGAFMNFASEYLALHGKVSQSFEPDSEVLRHFKDFLTRQGIPVPEEYWGPDQAYLKLRIKVEIFNLVFGLVVGDEVEVRSDPLVEQAVTLFPKIPILLKAPAAKPGALHVKRVARREGTAPSAP